MKPTQVSSCRLLATDRNLIEFEITSPVLTEPGWFFLWFWSAGFHPRSSYWLAT